MSEHRNYILGRDDQGHTRGDLIDELVNECESGICAALAQKVQHDREKNQKKGRTVLASYGQNVVQKLKTLTTDQAECDETLQTLAEKIVDMDYGSVSAFFLQWADFYKNRKITNKQVMMSSIARDFQQMWQKSKKHTTIIPKP